MHDTRKSDLQSAGIVIFRALGRKIYRMEEQALREAKRAHNFIWAAAEDYGFEPLFLAFSPDGMADLYLNLIIGLAHKWCEQEKLDAFFEQLGGKDEELYEGLLWIGLENALYEKEQKVRPALTALRQEYARESLQRYQRYREYARIEQLRNGHCREILGEPSGLPEEEERILHAFSYTGDMTTEQLLERTRDNLWQYFSYRPTAGKTQDGIYFLQKVAGAFHSVGKVSNTYVRAKQYEDENASTDGKAGTMEQARHYLLQFSVHRDPEETKRYVEACFGKSMYTEQQQEEVERQLCTGNHKNSHLLFTRGRTIIPKHTTSVQNTITPVSSRTAAAMGAEHPSAMRNEGLEDESAHTPMPWNMSKASITEDIQESQGAKPETMPEQESTIAAHGFHEKREAREIREFQTECAEQYRKNKAHFEQNRAIYQNSIRKLTESLKVCLETQDETFPTMATHGRIHAPSVWKAVYLDNPRVFAHREEVEIPGFSVDILMDASSSRKQMQEQIAAQAYVLAESLGQCGIPVQIYSYCSIRGFTVMRLFQSYDETVRSDALFHYVAAGNNRDGLALRAAGHLMETGSKARKILLVLTDASPQDDQDAGEGAFYKNKEYTDLLAVQDTAREVRALKQKGIQVIGIFMGSPRGGQVAGEIFGRELVKIRNIGEFSGAVGRILREVILS